jgi:predicted phosphodiesterase
MTQTPMANTSRSNPDWSLQSNAFSWRIHTIHGPARVLIISDIHIPYADTHALDTLFRFTEKEKITHVLLNGDIADFYAISRWETNPLVRNFPYEVSLTRDFLRTIRRIYRKAQILYKLGNHEERYETFLRRQAPDFCGLKTFDFSNLLEVDKLQIRCIRGIPIKLGRMLNVVHGHEYRFQISNPVNPARGLFLRAKSHIIGGHFHQSSQHSERTIDGKVIAAWSVGCLCDLHPEYRPLNNWNHGFAIVEVTASGGFQVHNYTIIDGKVL